MEVRNHREAEPAAGTVRDRGTDLAHLALALEHRGRQGTWLGAYPPDAHQPPPHLPHRFQPQEGIRFAEESLDLWVSHRLFLLDAWASESGLSCRQGLAQMAAVLGFELDPGFWSLLD